MTPDPTALIGVWSLHRRVVDRVASLAGQVHGTLTIAADDAGLIWFEQGTFTWRSDGGPATSTQTRSTSITRTLALRQHDDGWWMTFADGSLFHPWRPGEQVVHPCSADVYTGIVTVEPNRLRTLWDVTGPSKDQRLITRFTRLATP
jgi:hypothetical protein